MIRLTKIKFRHHFVTDIMLSALMTDKYNAHGDVPTHLAWLYPPKVECKDPVSLQAPEGIIEDTDIDSSNINIRRFNVIGAMLDRISKADGFSVTYREKDSSKFVATVTSSGIRKTFTFSHFPENTGQPTRNAVLRHICSLYSSTLNSQQKLEDKLLAKARSMIEGTYISR